MIVGCPIQPCSYTRAGAALVHICQYSWRMAQRPTDGGPSSGENDDDQTPPDRSPGVADMLSTTGGTGWPVGWPRLTQDLPHPRDTQAALFVGGTADGLLDEVPLNKVGQLPERIQWLGSIYGLAGAPSGPQPEFHFLGFAGSRDLTLRNPNSADSTTLGRERAAELRDQAGRRRDLAAHLRDEAGTLRDTDAERRDRRAENRRPTADGSLQAEGDIAQSAAAADRESSRIDRGVGAADRLQGQHDRTSALQDRSAAARDRRHASVDALTGVYVREAGLIELERDVARVARTGHSLVLAFVDVDHLKRVNDVYGHAAGDRMLQAVATTLQEALRSYDVVIRYGGDEFLCVIQGIELAVARPRFARVNVLLARHPNGGSVTVGLAAWQTGESPASLIQRADADLYRQRNHRREGPPTV